MLPRGRSLAEPVWQRRHRAIVRIAALQALLLGGFGYADGLDPAHATLEALVVAAPLGVAAHPLLGRRLRAAAATTSLFTASAVLVHLADGLTEAHFHFFVMVGLVAMYQHWVPFGVGLAIVVAHHGVLGTLHPGAVYGSSAGERHPWLWAAVHGGFVLAASATHLASWRLNEQQGLHDPLTGLANRVLLRETLVRLLRRRAPVGVLFIDLDDFKDVNDSRGHAVGDQLLRAVAGRLVSCVRSEDLVARLGGDEFAVVLSGHSDARRAAARIRAALGDPVQLEGQQVFVGASIGVADTSTSAERTGEALLRNADLAMYLAKAAGKNRIAVYADGMDRAAQDKAQLGADLAGALQAGQLEVHYQPTVALDSGRVRGYEALLRWHHPERGLVLPDVFIPLAEASGHIVSIGAWVLTTATEQAARWSREGQPVHIAVNLSPRQLGDDTIEASVATALSSSGLPAQQLTLEITEGVLVQDVDAVTTRLGRLRALGVRVAIDDFGTGYSGLSYLRRLPVDVVKIDRSFVHDLGSSGAATTLISSIIELARSMHLDVVAEGVETAEQATILRGLRCGQAQGFLYARPLPASDARPPAAVVDHRALQGCAEAVPAAAAGRHPAG